MTASDPSVSGARMREADSLAPRAEWGDSFRPAFARLGDALRGSVRPTAVLALTGTASKASGEFGLEYPVTSTND